MHQLSVGLHMRQVIVDGGNLGTGFNLGSLHWVRNIPQCCRACNLIFQVIFRQFNTLSHDGVSIEEENVGLWFERLPSINILEEMGHQSTLLGFLCLTLSILSGAVYHHRIGQTFLNVGPREWMIFIAWFAYLIYFHIRFSLGALGKKLAYIAIACYLLQIFAIFSI